MNTMTRGEKIDMFIEKAKRVAITSLLIFWGIVTMAMGIAYGMEHHKVETLERRIVEMEEQTIDLSDLKTVYFRY